MSQTLTSDTYSRLGEYDESMPDDFVRQQKETTDYPESIIQRWKTSAKPFNAPISRIHSSENKLFHLTKPVKVAIDRGEEYFFAENNDLAIFVTGETSEEALKEFCDQLIYFYYYYKNLDFDEVIGKASRLKKLYAKLFIETDL
jgi:hypothetical protein